MFGMGKTVSSPSAEHTGPWIYRPRSGQLYYLLWVLHPREDSTSVAGCTQNVCWNQLRWCRGPVGGDVVTNCHFQSQGLCAARELVAQYTRNQTTMANYAWN